MAQHRNNVPILRKQKLDISLKILQILQKLQYIIKYASHQLTRCPLVEFISHIPVSTNQHLSKLSNTCIWHTNYKQFWVSIPHLFAEKVIDFFSNVPPFPSQIWTLDMKGCICRFTKWQIHPFISKGTISNIPPLHKSGPAPIYWEEHSDSM